MSGSVGGLLAPLLEANGKAVFFCQDFLKRFSVKVLGNFSDLYLSGAWKCWPFESWTLLEERRETLGP